MHRIALCDMWVKWLFLSETYEELEEETMRVNEIWFWESAKRKLKSTQVNNNLKIMLDHCIC